MSSLETERSREPQLSRGELERRVGLILSTLDRSSGGLTRAHHIPGLFADLARDFDIEAFEARAFREGRIAPGRLDGPSGGVWYQGDTSYHAWFADEAEKVSTRSASPSTFLATTTLPLPRWALQVQQEILVAVHGAGEFGWSAELFFSREGAATMGLHADNDDVFTIQLFGEKTWQVDPVSLDRLGRLCSEGQLTRDGPESAWHFVPGASKKMLQPETIVMKAGDFLATPAFAMHHVLATGPGDRSLSFNVSVCREQVWLGHQEERARCYSPSSG